MKKNRSFISLLEIDNGTDMGKKTLGIPGKIIGGAIGAAVGTFQGVFAAVSVGKTMKSI